MSSQPGTEGAEAAAAVGEAATSFDSKRRVLAGAALCFFLSGFAALLYQTAWLRQFSLVFGTTELAVATVLAAYMGGTAAGAALAARYARRMRRPILAYGLLQAGVAVSAPAVPFLTAAAGGVYRWLLGGLPEPPDAAAAAHPVLYLAAAFVVLMLPTGLIGAALPLLTRYAVRQDRELGPKVALLYSINAAGAVGGTLAAAFALVPALGLVRTVWVGVGVNVAVFVAAALLSRKAGTTGLTAAEPLSAPPRFFASCIAPLVGLGGRPRRPAVHRQPAWILPLMLVSGANAFLYEVLWTRMLSHVIGGSIYAFGTMLAAFLAGVAAGSGLAGRVSADRNRAAIGFAVAQAGIAVLSIAVYAAMQALVPESRSPAAFAGYAALVMLPATLLIGATFPLAVRVLARGPSEASAATGSIYAWSTVGAIAGAVLGGLFLIPGLGFEGTIRLAVGVNLLLALVTAALVAPPKRVAVGAAAAALLAAAVLYRPDRPEAVIRSTAIEAPTRDPHEIFFSVGRSATVLVVENDGELELRTDGLPEASVLPKGAPLLGQSQQWMHALPIAARPDATSMLVVGLGGGVALEGVPRSIETIDVIELEPEVLAANRAIAELRAVDPLADPRVNVIINDARNALQLTTKKYDLIVSQPPHPWTAKSSHLFTVEFAALAKSRLDEGGVFLQRISAGFVDEGLLRSLAATLLEVYSNVRLYHAGGGTLFFLASDGSLDIERQILRTGRPLSTNVLHYSYLGLNVAEDFAAALVLDERSAPEFAAGAEPSTDDRNLMAAESRMLADGLDQRELLEMLAPYDPLLDAASPLRAELGERLSFAYVASRLLAKGQRARAARLAGTLQDPSLRALVEGLVRGAEGDLDGAVESLRVALDEDPGNDAARFALIEPQLPAIAAGGEDSDAARVAEDLRGAAAAVVRGWRLAADGDWEAVARLDGALAGASVTDLWYPYATQLRASWRTQVVGEPRYAFDALRMVDRVLLLRPGLDLYLLRAAAADDLGDALAFTETARYAARYLNDYLDDAERRGTAISDTELLVTARQLDVWQRRLGELRGEVNGRVSAVFDELGALLHRYESLARSRGLIDGG
ncbi:MAG TPA: fused MFS/spermidine synthase [Gammaproteobacteria bacterium]